MVASLEAVLAPAVLPVLLTYYFFSDWVVVVLFSAVDIVFFLSGETPYFFFLTSYEELPPVPVPDFLSLLFSIFPIFILSSLK